MAYEKIVHINLDIIQHLNFGSVRFKMVQFSSKRFGYGSKTIIKLSVRFVNHYNGSVNFGSVQFG